MKIKNPEAFLRKGLIITMTPIIASLFLLMVFALWDQPPILSSSQEVGIGAMLLVITCSIFGSLILGTIVWLSKKGRNN